MTKTKIALAAALFAATSSAAFAQGFDPDLSNRYQDYAQPGNYGYSSTGKLGSLQPARAATQSAQVRLQNHGKAFLQSAPVGLRNGSAPVLQQRDVALPTGAAASTDWFDADRFDHASSPYAGGN
jgi:hypothetical protein